MGDKMRNKTPLPAPALNPPTIKTKAQIAAKATPIMKRTLIMRVVINSVKDRSKSMPIEPLFCMINPPVVGLTIRINLASHTTQRRSRVFHPSLPLILIFVT